LAFQVFPLFWGQLQHEVGWKSLNIAFDCAVQCSGFYAVEVCQIGIEKHFFATDQKHQFGQVFWFGRDLRHGFDFL
jgi:hypothetical protein